MTDGICQFFPGRLLPPRKAPQLIDDTHESTDQRSSAPFWKAKKLRCTNSTLDRRAHSYFCLHPHAVALGPPKLHAKAGCANGGSVLPCCHVEQGRDISDYFIRHSVIRTPQFLILSSHS